MEFSDIRAIISYAYNLHKGNCLETTRRSVHVGSRPRPKLERNLYIFSSFFFFFFGSKEERKEERKRRASETKGSFKRIEKKKTISLIDTTRYRDFVFFFFFENLDLESSPCKSINAQSPIPTTHLRFQEYRGYDTLGNGSTRALSNERSRTTSSKLENFGDEIITAM